MKNEDILGLVISGFLGALTNIFHGLYQNMILGKRDLLIRFTVAVLAICPAYLFCEYMELPRDLSFIVGYISGALGDRVISEIYRRERRIFNFFAGTIDDETPQERRRNMTNQDNKPKKP
ncbi:MAG: hypothetical protein HKK67_13750 [Chlorobiaceae bacterium]|nr:hypothetical protein [Chlorobiaceae bacterium]